jgi:hypothetical protein
VGSNPAGRAKKQKKLEATARWLFLWCAEKVPRPKRLRRASVRMLPSFPIEISTNGDRLRKLERPNLCILIGAGHREVDIALWIQWVDATHTRLTKRDSKCLSDQH